jgi:hypothetical protein
LVSDIPAGDGKTANLFLQCCREKFCIPRRDDYRNKTIEKMSSSGCGHFIVTGSSPLLSSRLLIFILPFYLHLSHLLNSLSSSHDFPTIPIYSLSPSLLTSSITLSAFFPSPIPHQRERYPLSPLSFSSGKIGKEWKIRKMKVGRRFIYVNKSFATE